MPETWTVDAGHKTITVKGKGGSPDEAFYIEIREGGTQAMKIKVSATLNANGEDKVRIPLDPGTYDVKIRASSFGVNGHDYLGKIVSNGTPSVSADTKSAPEVTTAVAVGSGTLTVSGTGTPGEAIKIVVSQNGAQVATFSGNLDGTGQGSHTFTLPTGTYDVEVTAPDPGGTVYDFLGESV